MGEIHFHFRPFFAILLLTFFSSTPLLPKPIHSALFFPPSPRTKLAESLKTMMTLRDHSWRVRYELTQRLNGLALTFFPRLPEQAFYRQSPSRNENGRFFLLLSRRIFALLRHSSRCLPYHQRKAADAPFMLLLIHPAQSRQAMKCYFSRHFGGCTFIYMYIILRKNVKQPPRRNPTNDKRLNEYYCEAKRDFYFRISDDDVDDRHKEATYPVRCQEI